MDEDAFNHCVILLRSAPAEWPNAIELLGATEQQKAAEMMAKIAQRATFLQCYIWCRSQGLGHEESARLSNQAVTRVRRGLGKASPKEKGYNL